MNKPLSSLLALLLLAAAVMTGHQAMAADKTVTYTISYTGTNTIVATPNVAGFDGLNTAVTGPAINESNSNFGLFLHDNLEVIVNLYNSSGNHRMYVSNDGVTFNFAATINVACSSYYIKHIAMKDHNGTAIVVFDPSLPPQEQTNFSFDLNVDIDKVGASGAPSTVTDYHVRTANSPTTIKTITITYGESPRGYNIRYYNAVNGQNGVTNGNRGSYNVTTPDFNITAPTRTGYTFDGFTYTDAAHPTATSATLPMTISRGEAATRKEINFNASWTAHQYTVVFNKNNDDATGTMSNQVFTYDEAQTLTANGFTAPTGYYFTGWNTEADGSGTAYTDGQSVTNLTATNGATVNLYAQWSSLPTYIDENGNELTLDDFTVITAGMNGFDHDGWYVVSGNITLPCNAINPPINLLLCDGATLTIQNDDNTSLYVYAPIAIYGQAQGTGTLNASRISFNGQQFNINGGTINACLSFSQYNFNVDDGLFIRRGTVNATANSYTPAIDISQNSNLVISGGTVNATSEYGSAIRLGDKCNFTMNGGTLTATAYSYGISNYRYGSNCTINGGTLTASSTNGHAIYSFRFYFNGGNVSATSTSTSVGISGQIQLGWTNPTDRFYASSYEGTISIKSGKAFTDGTNIYTDATPSATLEALTDVTLQPAIPYLDENGHPAVCTNYTCITSDTPSFSNGGWYVVWGDVEMESLTFNSSGDFHLILCDGAHLHLTKYLNARYSRVNLNIYAQSGGSGTLTVNNTTNIYDHAIDIYSGTFTLNGGIVNCTYDATGGSKYGLYAKGVVVNGGSLTAISTGFNGRGIFINGGDLTVNGGTLTARCTHSESGYGIYITNDSFSGDITFKGGNVTVSGPQGGIYKNSYHGEFLLGWTNATDCYYVSSYELQTPVSIQAPQVLWNGEEALYGSVDQEDLSTKLNGKTLVPRVNSIYVNGFGGDPYPNYHWIFIASPVAEPLTPSDVTNLVADPVEHYDFYRLNPSNSMWENIKANTTENHPDFTSLVNGRGYLYANYYDILLTFPGTLNTATEQDVQVSAGYNLVGNPFGVPAYLSQPYYTLNEMGYNIMPELVNDAIMPCMGVIVQAAADGYVHFSTTAPTQQSTGGNSGSLNITLSQVVEPVETPSRSQVGPSTSSGTLTLDNAIVTFSEGSALGKFYFGEQDANIYLPQGNEDYAIAYSEGQGEMPLNFKATKNGEYTLSFDLDNVELAYLHLIDNLTGADIDLLAGDCGSSPAMRVPAYTFQAKTTDYESRFKLVFVAVGAGEDTCEPSFAFYSNGNWIISNEGRATLQVIDVNGRILSSEQINGSVSKAINQPAGVYMIRLINGENVKTQKMVIR